MVKAAAYSYIGLLSAYLKYYYPAEFMAAILTMAPDDKDPKKNKRAKYIALCEKKMELKISTPDINKSKLDFTPNGKEILYGLGSIKGVGAAALPDIIANAPYASLEDAFNRLPKKSFNKTIGKRLIMAGAFDFENKNRYALLNKFYDLRNEKDERFNEEEFNDEIVMNMEQESMGTYVSVKPWWDNINDNEELTVEGFITAVNEQKTKKTGAIMAFPELHINKCKVPGLIFSKTYLAHALEINEFFSNKNFKFKFSGKKDEKGTFIIKDISLVKPSF